MPAAALAGEPLQKLDGLHYKETYMHQGLKLSNACTARGVDKCQLGLGDASINHSLGGPGTNEASF